MISEHYVLLNHTKMPYREEARHAPPELVGKVDDFITRGGKPIVFSREEMIDVASDDERSVFYHAAFVPVGEARGRETITWRGQADYADQEEN